MQEPGGTDIDLPAPEDQPPQPPPALEPRPTALAALEGEAEEDYAPSDEEVEAILASDPTDRAPGQSEPGSEDEADPAEFEQVLREERAAMRAEAQARAEATAAAEGQEGAERDTGAQGA